MILDTKNRVVENISLRESPEVTEARRLSWFESNQRLFYVLKSEEQVVGYVLMLPLKREKIEKILSGEE